MVLHTYFEYTKGGLIKPPRYELQVKWVIESWEKIDKDIITKSFHTWGITSSNPDKIRCVSADQPIEEARVYLTLRTRSSVWNLKKNAGNFNVLVCCAAAN